MTAQQFRSELGALIERATLAGMAGDPSHAYSFLTDAARLIEQYPAFALTSSMQLQRTRSLLQMCMDMPGLSFDDVARANDLIHGIDALRLGADQLKPPV